MKIWKKLKGKEKVSFLFQTLLVLCPCIYSCVLYFSFVPPFWFQTGLCDSVVQVVFFSKTMTYFQTVIFKCSPRIKTESTAIGKASENTCLMLQAHLLKLTL